MNKILINGMQHFSVAVPALATLSRLASGEPRRAARRLRRSFTSGRVKGVVGIVGCSLPAWVEERCWGTWGVHAVSTGCPLNM